MDDVRITEDVFDEVTIAAARVVAARTRLAEAARALEHAETCSRHGVGSVDNDVARRYVERRWRELVDARLDQLMLMVAKVARDAAGHGRALGSLRSHLGVDLP